MMRLSLSNLAWPAERESEAFRLLSDLGVTGVEVAPTRLGPWESLTRPVLADYRSRIEAHGLRVSSLQAILFGRNGLQLLQDQEAFDAMAEHMRVVGGVAETLGARAMVFGSPRNRDAGALSAEQAWDIGRERWRILGRIAHDSGAVIGIEPVPAFYGGAYLAAWRDVLRMVRDVDHPGVAVHLDTGCVRLGGDSIAEAVRAAAPWLAHFHLAERDLGPFDAPEMEHAAAARALAEAGYGHWLAIEMREQPGDPLAAVATAVAFAKETYREV